MLMFYVFMTRLKCLCAIQYVYAKICVLCVYDEAKMLVFFVIIMRLKCLCAMWHDEANNMFMFYVIMIRLKC